MWDEPYTRHALEHGCTCCDSRVPTCYAVEFRLVPARLVRRRHARGLLLRPGRGEAGVADAKCWAV